MSNPVLTNEIKICIVPILIYQPTLYITVLNPNIPNQKELTSEHSPVRKQLLTLEYLEIKTGTDYIKFSGCSHTFNSYEIVKWSFN